MSTNSCDSNQSYLSDHMYDDEQHDEGYNYQSDEVIVSVHVPLYRGSDIAIVVCNVKYANWDMAFRSSETEYQDIYDELVRWASIAHSRYSVALEGAYSGGVSTSSKADVTIEYIKDLHHDSD